ncbi:mitogen-activated protein kinase kinase kinase 20-like [Humulus lupulus]|uniref:mitogen-activated protein kinase kinase kinase 20-like n=1 Tax=Humulus lupulus TaxID=3486 RepID=UPI002B40CFA0|nr:mitogen-activated protein kinase kinase kinase 20-like [Humulus lupulus]
MSLVLQSPKPGLLIPLLCDIRITPTNKNGIHKLVAIKRSKLQHSHTLQKEKRIYSDLNNSNRCTEIVTCFGNDISIEKDSIYNNLILEYAYWGTLDQLIRRRISMVETNIRIYTKMMLKGLSYIHAKGYVHCDFKPENILVFPTSDKKNKSRFKLKIADFGLAREPEEVICRRCYMGRFKGTPVYMSPESVALGEITSALDIWSLGCVVVEMCSGINEVWNNCESVNSLIDVLVFSDKIPNIPRSISGMDFLGKCFERDHHRRWTANMLLNHPFVTGSVE